uniref:uncharacterized protein n=1 Tax=Semicossyphus pulcher TaxID=241346 RepID=UPI0037E79401
MSAALYSASGNTASLQGTTVGGTKPLQRFIKGQPKIIGIILLILGSSFFIVSISITTSIYSPHIWSTIPPGILLGVLFIICGILYILTEHNPTKKTVTISLALSIVTILASVWTVLHIVPDIIHRRYYGYHADSITEDEVKWSSYYETMGLSVEVVFLIYSLLGGIIFIVMSVMAGAALRSSKSQALLVMTTTPTETPAEQHAQDDGLNCEIFSGEK